MFETGLPGYEVRIKDESVLIGAGLRGLYAIVGITEFAEDATPKLVLDQDSYNKNFGKQISGDIATFFAKKLLDAKIPFWMVPVHHYTDVTDRDTLVGTKSSLSIDNTIAAETKATGTITFTVAGANGNKVEVTVIEGTLPRFIGSYTVQTSDTVTLVAAGLKAAINALTASHGYTADNTAGVLTITAPAGSGSTANSYVLTRSVTGSIASTVVSFASGVDAIGLCEFELTAKAVGPAFDEATVEIREAISGQEDLFDIVVRFRGYTTVVPDLIDTPSEGDTAAINAALGMLEFTSIVKLGILPPTALSSGAEDKALITTQDYIGDVSAQTGIYAALKLSLDAHVGITVPANNNYLIAKALESFVSLKPGIRGLFRVPTGYTSDAAIAFREQTGQVLSAVDSYRVSLVEADIKMIDPSTGAVRAMPGTIQIVYATFRKDMSVGAWASVADPEFAKWSEVQTLDQDFTTYGLKAQGGQMYKHGINLFTKDDVEGIVPYGNVTLLKAASQLKKWNVADYFLMVERELPTIMKSVRNQFKANDPTMWYAMFLAVTKYVEVHKQRKAIYDYAYEGDQYVTDVTKVTVNTVNGIVNGDYIFNLWLFATSVTERIGANVISTTDQAKITLINSNS